jgi:hypothetical protein
MKKLLTAFLILAATPAWANWVLFQKTGDSFTYYDPSTITGESMKRVVVKIERQQPTQGIYSMRAQEEIDCNQRRKRLLSLTTFSAPNLSGKVMGKSNEPEGWRPIVSGSVAESLFLHICKGRP